ncbi:hypothetical protein B296_00052123 [Ensete ventricosum]|uniref:J domain-containing protein n=1 Tax=Ensete ventricosum TaxID=4639 RepID=A0A426XGP2_ENSVE|nr:hypothetical protein B296_00052123 [Ensete ventricosum]
MSRMMIFSGTSSTFFPGRGVSLRTRVVAEAVATSGMRRAPASLYQVLMVGETATTPEIKAAYRAMAKWFHPDVAPVGGGPDFRKIRRAYETLSDPAARARYDRSIVGWIPRAESVVFRQASFQEVETNQC